MMSFVPCFGNSSVTTKLQVGSIPNKNVISIDTPNVARRPTLTQTRQRSLRGDPSRRFKNEKILQRGSTSVVSKCTDLVMRKQIALKKVKWPFLSQIKREFDIQKTVSEHPNIAGVANMLKDFDNREVYILMELLDGGDLVEVVTRKREGMNAQVFVSYARQLASGLLHMHSKGVVHRDIKPDNICSDTTNGSMKFVDFGDAAYVDETIKKYMIGTMQYIAPELIVAQQMHDSWGDQVLNVDLKACDVWSLGVTFYSMLSRKLPFKEASLKDTNYSIYQHDNRNLGTQKVWATFDPEMRTLLRNMLQIDPRKRWRIGQVVEYLIKWQNKINP
ncbi:serine/threonine protein kinase [Sphaeroforma arctica JP610]|uniref:Serine/threonine protein kinase n=1 Tax=Sphaeroforma arctica JP610 TaxID=667725 RepID=A0A0L0FLM2_9EUKA|nr:serine/threonine protein kinase [Sphaeroforma arctica JP610]KNC77677.1 serine/threonine protein kinase [Sphaeroforma arctica JP610]|eukprot:XP_014151579.1 serine/threonine protein kinase [Sphaeroforma arctica JP610]